MSLVTTLWVAFTSVSYLDRTRGYAACSNGVFVESCLPLCVHIVLVTKTAHTMPSPTDNAAIQLL